MQQLNFYPGPSRVYDKVPEWTKEAFEKGILSINHRSDTFVNISQKVHDLLKDRLNIPQDYQIFYISSATEAWEIILQSLVEKETLHIHNGAFGEKWAMYAEKIRGKKNTQRLSFDLNTLPNMEQISQNINSNTEILCFTHNETSNGTYLPNFFFQELKRNFPQPLIAIDATSSMAGIDINWKSIDVAFASVQKCFGLPAGMGIMIASPKTVEKAKDIAENTRYNSFLNLLKHAQNFQTTHTPNVLSIYLLLKSLEELPNIQKTEKRLREQANMYYSLFEQKQEISYLIQNKAVQSPTVICISGKENYIQEFKEKTKKQNIILGNGYGAWKSTSFRIANFPAMSLPEIELFKELTLNNLFFA